MQAASQGYYQDKKKWKKNAMFLLCTSMNWLPLFLIHMFCTQHFLDEGSGDNKMITVTSVMWRHPNTAKHLGVKTHQLISTRLADSRSNQEDS